MSYLYVFFKLIWRHKAFRHTISDIALTCRQCSFGQICSEAVAFCAMSASSFPLRKAALPCWFASSFYRYRNRNQASIAIWKMTDVLSLTRYHPQVHPPQLSVLLPQKSQQVQKQAREPPSVQSGLGAAVSHWAFLSGTVTSHLAPSTAQGGQEPSGCPAPARPRAGRADWARLGSAASWAGFLSWTELGRVRVRTELGRVPVPNWAGHGSGPHRAGKGSCPEPSWARFPSRTELDTVPAPNRAGHGSCSELSWARFPSRTKLGTVPVPNRAGHGSHPAPSWALGLFCTDPTAAATPAWTLCGDADPFRFQRLCSSRVTRTKHLFLQIFLFVHEVAVTFG